jgi:hypothetical protein
MESREMDMRTFKISLVTLALSTLAWPGSLPAQVADTQERTEELGRELGQVSAEFMELFDKAGSAVGEDLLIVETQIRRRGRRLREGIGPFIAGIVELRDEGRDVSELQTTAEQLLDWALRVIRTELDRLIRG